MTSGKNKAWVKCRAGRKRCGACKYHECLTVDGRDLWVCALTYEDLNRGRFMCGLGEG
jgi:hypothetical protein